LGVLVELDAILLVKLNATFNYKHNVPGALRKSIGEIDSRCKFHQHFKRKFFADILVPKNCKAKRNKRKLFLQKTRHKMLMKLTPEYQ